MVNVHIWKLGNHYEHMEDRNGGKAEFSYIYNAIAKACAGTAELRFEALPTFDESSGRIVTFIVNGVMSQRDDCKVEFARRHSDVLVYILTDYGFIENNLSVIEQSDFILHQSPMEDYSLAGILGTYSYIPELFYDEKLPESILKMDLCFFGGNEAGREEEFNEYIIDQMHSLGYPNSIRSGMAAFYKSKNGEDFRVSYNDYRRVLSLFKFAFVSGRTAGKDVGWVTPRLVEAVNAGCIPIIINDYDPTDHFGFGCFKVQGYKELQQLMEEADEMDMGFIMDRAKNDFKEGQKKFDALVKHIVVKFNPLQSQ